MTENETRPLMAAKASSLKGTISVPGDKSISHRALMLGALAIGETTISGLLESEDVLNTAKAMAALGAHVERDRDGTWSVTGVGLGGFTEPRDLIDFGNAGTGVRLCAGLVATSPIKVGFTGDDSLRSRPMNRITVPLKLFGAQIDTLPDGLLPMRIKGAVRPVPVRYKTPVASAQVKSAILLAGLNAPGTTSVIEAEATRDHTEKMLAGFGADISVSHGKEGHLIEVRGHNELTACQLNVPGDPSSAAFAIVAALTTPNSEVTVTNCLLNPTRIGLIDTLLEMGANIKITNKRQSGGEALGDVTAKSSNLVGVTVPAGRAPSMIDEYPILAVAAAKANGKTLMEGVGELRVKESDRLAFVEAGLKANGVEVSTGPDWMEVTGAKTVSGGGLVKTGLDHRIAMSFLVLGFVAEKPVVIDDGDVISTSFPGFVDLMSDLGAEFSPAELA